MNASHDYIRKLNLYTESGVKEYWIVDYERGSIFVYYLAQDHFNAVAYSFCDTIKVNIYDDLYIDFSKMNI